MNKLHQKAKECLGLNLSPIYKEYGCVEALNNVFNLAYNKSLGENASTFRLYNKLQLNPDFIEIMIPLPGDLVISPTGFGNGRLVNGHAGIIGENCIYSNNSSTLQWDTHYNLESWKKRYVDLGGFPMKFYRLVDNDIIKKEAKEVELLQQQLSLLQRLVVLLKELLNRV